MAGTLVANTINTDTGLFSTQNAYQGIAKAWVNYNSVAQTITGSFNVSSVTYSSTGNFTVNFTTAMTNANYAVATCCKATGSSAPVLTTSSASAPTTTSIALAMGDIVNYQNVTLNCVVIFGA